MSYRVFSKNLSSKRIKCYLPICKCFSNDKISDHIYTKCFKESQQKYLKSLDNQKTIIEKFYENKINEIFLL